MEGEYGTGKTSKSVVNTVTVFKIQEKRVNYLKLKMSLSLFIL